MLLVPNNAAIVTPTETEINTTAGNCNSCREYPANHPARIADDEAATERRYERSCDHASDSTAAIEDAAKIEIAAPVKPYIGDRTKNVIRNTAICKQPIMTSPLNLFEVFIFAMLLLRIAAGIMLRQSMKNDVPSEA